MKYKRNCALCNKEFIASNYRVKICPDDHYLTCPICGKQYIHNSLTKSKGCSRSCAAKGGVAKRRKTSLEKYGVEMPTQAASVIAKRKQTCLEKYGVENPMSDPTIAKRSRDSRKTSYDEVFEKAKKTWLERYGVDNPSKCPELIDKMTDTFMTRYGVKRAMSVPEFREKFEQTMMQNYGVPYYTQTDEYRKNEFFRISKTNQKFAELLEQHDISYKSEFSIGRKSYDFIIPNQKILIEINPTYTHNILGNHWNKTGISENYHLEKTKLAESKGYRCIHVFDWDDWDKIIQLLKPTKSIYARDCTIYKLNNDVAKEFTEKNHLQKSCRGQLFCLGLVQNGELYQVMTFGKPRFNKNYSVELLRLCSKSGYRIVGGASRLFKYATDNFGIDNIISYCNHAKFKGEIYTNIGMKFVKHTQPQEIWSKENQSITANLLRSRGYDQLFGTNYGKGTSNDKLMLENGWLPVYDCGQKVFEYRRTED